MKHFKLIYIALICCLTIAQISCKEAKETSLSKKFPEALSKKEWKKKLSSNAYYIMVEQGTEPSFNNAYYNNHKKGIYVSAATGKPLFSSKDKFDSGTGWPSFTKPISNDACYLDQR
ncbi:peptide-methionine (R)-S-oxide reductase [Flavobacterium jejuense]|uniref:peptide-methionine (R)-S-oxide reductase n=1 Tax=Flavobacterium jejuense TaxID=1544455 RepID=UPI001AA031A3|nr:peptide-methionine (R)-S-oxide reductase [Flavobacterium jejuense]